MGPLGRELEGIPAYSGYARGNGGVRSMPDSGEPLKSCIDEWTNYKSPADIEANGREK